MSAKRKRDVVLLPGADGLPVSTNPTAYCQRLVGPYHAECVNRASFKVMQGQRVVKLVCGIHTQTYRQRPEFVVVPLKVQGMAESNPCRHKTGFVTYDDADDLRSDGYEPTGKHTEIDWEGFEKGPNEGAEVWTKAGAPEMLVGRETGSVVPRSIFGKKADRNGILMTIGAANPPGCDEACGACETCRHSAEKTSGLRGAALGKSLAVQYRRYVLDGGRVDGTFEEWLSITAGGDTQAEIAGQEHYRKLIGERSGLAPCPLCGDVDGSAEHGISRCPYRTSGGFYSGSAQKNRGGPKYTERTVSLDECQDVPGFAEAIEKFREAHHVEPTRVRVFDYEDGSDEVDTRVCFKMGDAQVVIDTVEDEDGNEVRIKPLKIGTVYTVSKKTGGRKSGVQWIHDYTEGGGKPPINAVDVDTGIEHRLGGSYEIRDGWYEK